VAALRAGSATAASAGTPTKFEALGPIRRRTELLAGFPVAAELIVGRTLLGGLQDLIRLLDLLEAGLGVLLLAHVRMELTRQPPIGFLDLIRGGGALDAQNLVVI